MSKYFKLQRPMISSNIHFARRVDDTDPFSCPRDALQRLLDDSPGEFELGFLSGIFQFREQMALLTEIKFD